MVNLSYTVLTSTNLAANHWTAIGSVGADTNGDFQFLDSSAPPPQRFYLLSSP